MYNMHVDKALRTQLIHHMLPCERNGVDIHCVRQTMVSLKINRLLPQKDTNDIHRVQLLLPTFVIVSRVNVYHNRTADRVWDKDSSLSIVSESSSAVPEIPTSQESFASILPNTDSEDRVKTDCVLWEYKYKQFFSRHTFVNFWINFIFKRP
jgi:hypothetical protein